MGFYDGLAATAAKLLASKGQTVTLRRAASSTYNTADSSASVSTPTDIARNAAVFDFAKGITVVRGNMVEKNDQQILMEPGEAPAVADKVIVGTTTFTIVSVGQLSPAGTPVLYDLHVRAG